MLSLLVPQNRIGGLDLLATSLRSQTFRDFELILLDAIAPYRREKHRADFDGLSVNWLDCSFGETNLRTRYMRSLNRGIEHARGETLVYLPDYAWLNPDCLATHHEMQTKHRAPVMLDYNYAAIDKPVQLPYYGQAEHPADDPEDFTKSVNATTARYVADLQAGRLDRFLWQLGPTPNVASLPVTHRHRPCSTREANDWNWASFKNESFPTELLLDMNGHDERFDVSHCWQDQEFTQRLKLRGVQWVNGPAETGMLTVCNPRPFLNVKHMPEVFFTNRTLCENVTGEVNPEFSLRERRKERLG